ncbi:hypothetical protein OSB04_015326 [Centaurea solstitialis]|uniref:Uncharacterized protein n=1 Tax=Centaurea solstitialis TaxID=347529 RepID=A0AA38TC68_9ASTR|nr:hypothetical protein OSB04_015326 [Centaurea solstitialis]
MAVRPWVNFRGRSWSSRISPVPEWIPDTRDFVLGRVGECIGTWWKSDFETLPYPYLPSSGKTPRNVLSLPCEVAIKSGLHCAEESQVTSCSTVPASRKSQDLRIIISGIPQLLSSGGGRWSVDGGGGAVAVARDGDGSQSLRGHFYHLEIFEGNGIEFHHFLEGMSHFEVPYEMRHGREPLRRSSGSYEGSFELILVMG